MKCRRCLFLISDTLNVGGKAVVAAAAGSIFASFFSPPPSFSLFTRSSLFLLGDFPFFFLLQAGASLTGTSVKSIVGHATVFLTCVNATLPCRKSSDEASELQRHLVAWRRKAESVTFPSNRPSYSLVWLGMLIFALIFVVQATMSSSLRYFNHVSKKCSKI